MSETSLLRSIQSRLGNVGKILVIGIALYLVIGCSRTTTTEEKIVTLRTRVEDRADYPGYLNFLTARNYLPPIVESQQASLIRRLMRSTTKQGPIVRLVGFDGVGWPELNLMLDKGLMPNLQRLLSKGAAAVLRTDTSLSPVAWTTIACGKDYKHHGILPEWETSISSFSYAPEAVRVARVWDIFSHHGIRTRLGKYFFIQDGSYRNQMMDNQCTDLLTGLAQLDYGFFASYIEATDYWEHQGLLAFYLLETDWGRQFTIESMWLDWIERMTKLLTQVFIQMDQTLGELLDRYPNDYLIVVSDHGFRVDQPTLGIELRMTSPFFLPDRSKQKVKRPSTIPGEPDANYFKIDGDLFLQVTKETRHYKVASNKQTGAEIVLKVTSPLLKVFFSESADYEKAAQVYDELRNFTSQRHLVFSSVSNDSLRISDEFVKAFLYNVIPGYHQGSDQMIYSFMRSTSLGTHNDRDQGIFMAYGPEVRNGVIVEELDLVDVTPTLLYMGGLPVGNDMQGKVVESIFNAKYLEKHPVTYADSYDFLVASSVVPESRQSLTPEQRKAYKESGYPGIE